MGFAKERFTKNLRSDRKSKQKPYLTTVIDEAAQARHVASQILQAREAGMPLKAQATLFRASSHSAQLELELARRNIPFVKYGGLKFLEAAHVKDMLSVLRWCENIGDRIAGFRILQLLPGIGPTTAGKILDKVEGQPSLVEVLPRIAVPKAAAEDWPAFAKLIVQLARPRKLGQRNFNGFAPGTSRISIEFTTMPKSERLTLHNLSKLRAAIHRANSFLPTSRLTRRIPRLVAQALL